MKPAANTEEMRTSMQTMQSRSGPTIFQLRAQLPKLGRTDTLLAATELMNVVLKTYAADGENTLHAHPNEDHVFVVMQGEAEFRSHTDERRVVGRHQGIMLPRGTLYRFTAIGDEPLVLLRIGAIVDHDADPLARIDRDGRPMDGYSATNKQVEPQMIEPPEYFE